MTPALTPAPGRRGQLYFMRGDQKKLIARNLDMGDADAVQQKIRQAQEQYPTQQLRLGIYQLSGSSPRLVDTLTLNGPAPTPDTPDDDPMAYEPETAPSRRAGSNVPPGMDSFTTFLFIEKENQLQEVKDLNRELRDTNRAREDDIRRLQEENRQLKQDLQFKDREHQLQIRQAEVEAEAESKGGLNGLVETAMGNPALIQQLLPVVMGLFGRNLPAGPAAPAQLGGAGLSEGHQQMISTVAAWMGHSEEYAAKIYGALNALLQLPNGLDLLTQFAAAQRAA